MVFSKKVLTFFFTPKKWENRPQKLLIIGPTPFISQSSPDQRPTAQNWFFILVNLGTRHLFSYLWIKAKERSLTLMSITIVSVFGICNSFYSIYYILRTPDFNNRDAITHSTARVFAVINSSANIVIYIVFNSKFRETFVSLISRFSFEVTEDPTKWGKLQETSRHVVSKSPCPKLYIIEEK